MRIFKNRWFSKFARKEGISDLTLLQAAREVVEGNFDADYGSGVIKQRIARSGQGKSGGYRTIILVKRDETAFFVFGFAKSDVDNISKDDVRGFKKLSNIMNSLSPDQLETLIEREELEEIQL